VGIALGLVLGKPIGIFLTSWLAVKTKLGSIPTGATWSGVLGAGMLAGIGFTMSFFVSMLAFPGHHEIQDLAKISILIASTTAGVIGYIWMSTMKVRS
jgi:NhaA family Na+:H+ antiporter